ncbi:MAG: HAD family hydrolase [Proteobacteria bacterium]|nr:MAG: HAD family hydrolase [Pseudomonadota bacterium]
MKPLSTFPHAAKTQIRYVLTDIDDTLTLDGRLPAAAYGAMERLQEAGIKVVPITGRPAGWCDHIARMWPVDGLVGENGAFYFVYDQQQRKMIRCYWRSEEQRLEDRERLALLAKAIVEKVPGCRVSVDQPYREADLAIDVCEDVPPLDAAAVEAIVRLFEAAGATVKVSSIHVNGWFGEYDKLSMTKRLFAEVYGVELEEVRERVIFSGDSPNDAPMFGYFPSSVGVANVLRFRDELKAAPTWITQERGGLGFAELVDVLLDS